ncbi:MAG: response regulator transcription factor [Oscillospiraceae bacterium]|jgi:two-component system KDP operon response regulator KdpE|nr:response regulator transcription factor [Oscillospiraceae bacterium]MCI1991473.1 response regulator transcription factor [Oscillospiraceae bacterium]
MQNKSTVLVAENQAHAGDPVCATLKAGGYRALTAENGSTAISMIASHCPDLVLLDSGLPETGGLDVLQTVRKWSEIPIIVFASDQGGEDEEVKALDMGADDYLMKPFGSSELLARIRTALRHSIKMETGENVSAGCLRRGRLTMDLARHSVTVGGRKIHLTQNEYKIVLLLAKHCGQVLTYSYIIEHVWGHFAADDRQILRVNMANIRRKMEPNPAEPEYIVTEIGVGYRMKDNPGDGLDQDNSLSI